jgi:hypothetical protein
MPSQPVDLLLLLLPAFALAAGEDERHLPTKGRTPPTSGGRWRTPGGNMGDVDDLGSSDPPTGMGKKEWARVMSQMRDQLAEEDASKRSEKQDL